MNFRKLLWSAMAHGCKWMRTISFCSIWIQHLVSPGPFFFWHPVDLATENTVTFCPFSLLHFTTVFPKEGKTTYLMSCSDCQLLWQGFEQLLPLWRGQMRTGIVCPTGPLPDSPPGVWGQGCTSLSAVLQLQLVGAASWTRHYHWHQCLRSEFAVIFLKGEALNHHHWTESGITAKVWQRLSWNALFMRSLRVVGLHEQGASTAWHGVLAVVSDIASGDFVLWLGKGNHYTFFTHISILPFLFLYCLGTEKDKKPPPKPKQCESSTTNSLLSMLTES